MRKIEFTQDFATKKSGEVWECDNSLASTLVHHDKVAKYIDITFSEEIVSEVIEDSTEEAGKEIEIVVTEETLELNPELVDEGVKEGDVIGIVVEEIPNEEAPAEPEIKEPVEKAKKK